MSEHTAGAKLQAAGLVTVLAGLSLLQRPCNL